MKQTVRLLGHFACGVAAGLLIEILLAAVLWLFFAEPRPPSAPLPWFARLAAYILAGVYSSQSQTPTSLPLAVASPTALALLETSFDHILWHAPSRGSLLFLAAVAGLYGCYLSSRAKPRDLQRRSTFARKLLRHSAASWVITLGAVFPFFVLWRGGFGLSGLGCSGLLKVIVLAFAFGFAGFAVRIHEEDKLHWLRQSETDFVVSALLSQGKAPYAFVLYLRPFFITAKLGQKNAERDLIFTPGSFSGPTVIDIEADIAREIERSAVFLALGKTGEFPGGASRITTSDEEWMKLFEILATAASAVIVVPSERPGTRWELSWLKDRSMLDKCVFIMPPKGESKLPLGEIWSRTQEDLTRSGIHIPSYNESGGIFSLNETANIRQRQLFAASNIAGSVRKIIRSESRNS